MNTKNYEYITEHDALNYTLGRQGEAIKYIIIHHWGALGQSFEGVLNWFCKNPACQTSAHYVAEEGKVACIVAPENTAWHAGLWDYNLKSIGIECRPEATPGDYLTVAELIADLWSTYGVLPLIGHRDVPGVPTSCPGIWNVAKLYNMAMNIRNSDEVSEWAKPSWEWGKLNGITDGTNPKKEGTREEFVTMLYRYDLMRKGS